MTTAIGSAISDVLDEQLATGRWKTDPSWGNITGTLSDQIDLQAVLNSLSTSITDLQTRVDTLENAGNGTPPPPEPTVYGCAWAGDNLANLEVGGQNGGSAGRSVSFRFKAQAAGSIEGVRVFVKTGTGYSLGNGGDIKIELRTDDDTPDHFPTNTVLGATNYLTDPLGGGNLRTFIFPVPPAVVAGTLYHLVWVNDDPSPANNYVSANCMQPALGSPKYTNAELGVAFKSSGGASWAYNAKCPIFTLIYQDGSRWGPGNPHSNARSSSLLRTIEGNNMVRTRFTVSGGNKTVTAVHVRLRKVGSPGALTVRLEASDGTLIEQGIIAATAIGTSADWTTYTFGTPRTLVNGSTYHLRLSAASNASNRYETWPLTQGTGFESPEMFTDGVFQYTSDGSSWTSSSNDDAQIYFDC